jgi:hypothetical protein
MDDLIPAFTIPDLLAKFHMRTVDLLKVSGGCG